MSNALPPSLLPLSPTLLPTRSVAGSQGCILLLETSSPPPSARHPPRTMKYHANMAGSTHPHNQTLNNHTLNSQEPRTRNYIGVKDSQRAPGCGAVSHQHALLQNYRGKEGKTRLYLRWPPEAGNAPTACFSLLVCPHPRLRLRRRCGGGGRVWGVGRVWGGES